VLAHCRGRLASYKCPETAELVSALPKNVIGQVLKPELRAARIGSS
jgi:acyl-CoA synthetase (AMP-forming)/AMP-acid ligase II